MEVDNPVPLYLEEKRKQAPENLKAFFTEFIDLYDKKLWHQLTLKVEEFICQSNSSNYLIPLFENFIKDWEPKMNRIKYVGFGLACARQYQDFSKAISFLDEVVEKTNSPNSLDANILAKMERAHYCLLLGDIETIKKTIEECQTVIDELNTVETIIHASFYRVSADYFKAKANFTKYYQNALLYLACVNAEDLSPQERAERAYDLSLAALLGQTIYNFGEFLQHPIVDTLKSNESQWLYDLLFAFNSGDIAKFESLSSNFSKIPILQAHMPFLQQKICLMSLIEFVFKRNSNDRAIPFSQISSETKLPIHEVEHLVMKALSLDLLKGSIDQCNQTILITWVQPRYLDKDQVKSMVEKIDFWDGKVSKMCDLLENLSPELLA